MLFPLIRRSSGARRRWNGLAALVLGALFVLHFTPSGRAGPALVFDTRTGEVLHAYGAYTPWHPASLTKMMTIYVAFQAIEEGRVSLQSPVRISALALSQPPSKMGFPVGSEITLDQALRILMVKSANDIAVAVAEAVGGSHDAFISRMNATARRLGMRDTYYSNPHGLHDPRQRTTAHDLALLTRALIRDFAKYQGYFEISSIQVGKSTLRNHNKLIANFRGADGMKTGYICASGFNIVATATRGGRRLAAVVLGGLKSSLRDQVTMSLLEAGFEQGRTYSVFNRSAPTIDSLPRPAAIGAPVDMKPYVCQKQKAPAEILSFGMEAATQTANASDPSRVLNPSGSALALQAASVIDLGPIAPGQKPVPGFDIPLPRSRPADAPLSTASIPASPAASPKAEPTGAYPRPNPLR